MTRWSAITLFVLSSGTSFGDRFLDDALNYGFEPGSKTKVYVSGRRNSSVTEITIPTTVVYEYVDYDDSDDEGHYKTKHRNCTVRSIGEQAFARQCGDIVSVTIPNGILDIGPAAFEWCGSLVNISIPNSVTNIGGYAFAYCSALQSVTIPDGIIRICHGAFQKCTKLVNITIPDGMTRIEEYMFADCKNLTDVTIPDSVLTIEEGVFARCKGLQKVELPDSVKYIGLGVFSCTDIESISIPDSVTDIGVAVFESCVKLKNVKLGQNVKNLGYFAFRDCGSLTNVTFMGAPPKIVDSDGTMSQSYVYSSSPYYSYSVGICDGTYLPSYASEWNMEIDANGNWHEFKMRAAQPPTYTVTYDANGGTGSLGATMEAQTFEDGEEQKLSKNTYRKEGHVFQGWATTLERATAGTVDYTDEQKITVESDMTLHAVWTSPLLTLVEESADWTSLDEPDVTITFRCTDADTSGTEHSYWLLNYDNTSEKWLMIDGAHNVKAIRETDANGNSVLLARMTDERFARRNNGLSTVEYKVVDENGRLSNICVTRNRHGLFIALGKYEDSSKNLPTAVKEAELFRAAYSVHGDCRGYQHYLYDSDATKGSISNQLVYVANTVVKPGDLFVLYYCGHGYEGGYVTCYEQKNPTLSASELRSWIGRFPDGVGTVVLLNTCHAASMMTIDNGESEIGWIVSSQAEQKTPWESFTKCIVNKGWLYGGADYDDGNVSGNDDGYVTFGELARWGAMWNAKNYYRDRIQMTYWSYGLLLDKIVAGRVPNHSPVTPLVTGPSSLTAKQGGPGEIKLSWMAVDGATGYDVYRKQKDDPPASYVYVKEVEGSTVCSDVGIINGVIYEFTPNVEYEYIIRAKNDVYVSNASPSASCTPTVNTELRDYALATVSVSSAYYSVYPLVENGEVNYSNLNYDHDGDGFTTFQEYITGSDPADKTSSFKGKLIMTNGVPYVTWSPNLNTNGMVRNYTVWGKTNLTDEAWHTPTNSASRFFKVTVEMP